MFRGSFTALVTPFRGGDIDWKTFENLIEFQIAEGTNGLVICGTTGEAPSLTASEHRSLIERAVTQAAGRIAVIAGTGSNVTAKTVELTLHAKFARADAALIVTPYYNKPSQEGLYLHYKTVADAADIPIIIYNIPGRCAVDMNVDTIARTAKACRNIIGVKDATSDISRVRKMSEAAGPDFCLLSGDDSSSFDFMDAGGHGCISVTSNVAPGLCSVFHQSFMKGDKKTARTINDRLMPLHRALFCEVSPQPVKYAVSRLGFGSDEMRLPLIPASAQAREMVDAAMAQAGLISAAGQPILRAYG